MRRHATKPLTLVRLEPVTTDARESTLSRPNPPCVALSSDKPHRLRPTQLSSYLYTWLWRHNSDVHVIRVEFQYRILLAILIHLPAFASIQPLATSCLKQEGRRSTKRTSRRLFSLGHNTPHASSRPWDRRLTSIVATDWVCDSATRLSGAFCCTRRCLCLSPAVRSLGHHFKLWN